MVANSREKGHHYQLSKLFLSQLLSLCAREIVKDCYLCYGKQNLLFLTPRANGF